MRQKILSVIGSKKYSTDLFLFLFLFLTCLFNVSLLFQNNSFLDNDWNLSSNSNVFDAKNAIRGVTRFEDFYLYKNSSFSHYNIISREKCFPLGYYIPVTGIHLLFHLSPITIHNLFFLISFFLSGLTMFFLAKKLTKNSPAAFLAGVLYMTSNYLTFQFMIGHINQMILQWIPLIFLLIEYVLEKKEVKYAILLGLVLAIQLYSSLQYFLYLTIVLFIYGLIRFKTIIKKERLIQLGVTFGTFVILTGYYLFRRITTPAIVRSPASVAFNEYVLDSFHELIGFNSHLQITIISLSLAMLGIFYIFKYKEKRLFAYVGIFLSSLWLSTGMLFKFSLYGLFYYVWPFMNRFRTPQRFFPFTSIAVSVLVAYGVSKIKFRKKYQYYLFVSLILILIIILKLTLSPIFNSQHMVSYDDAVYRSD